MRVLALAVVLAVMASAAWAADDDGMAFWKENLSKGLVNAKGEEVKLDQLKGKIVGVYFSAHWCPPCKAFTPKLVEFRDKNAKDFEVVFVSADHTEKEQQGYMTETKMLWPAVKWHSEEANALMKKYKVSGIPKLVILGPDGKTLSENGRGDVTSNPDKCLEEWKKAAASK